MRHQCIVCCNNLMFKYKVVNLAKEQLKIWWGVKEKSRIVSETLKEYWKSVGKEFNIEQMQSSSVHSEYPWSSAFISHLFLKAGAMKQFPYSASHSGYFQKAKEDRFKRFAPLRGYRIAEYAPKFGDIIINSRQEGVDYDTKGFFPSHGEIVVEVGEGFVKSIGGNVGDSVKESTITTDKGGFLTKNEKDFFMVIQNRIK